MGRWAQRSIRGGGPPATSLIEIDEALFSTPTAIHLRYTGTVDASAFLLTDFLATPDNVNPIEIEQLDPTHVRLGFDFGLDTNTVIHYTGAAPGVLTPQDFAL